MFCKKFDSFTPVPETGFYVDLRDYYNDEKIVSFLSFFVPPVLKASRKKFRRNK